MRTPMRPHPFKTARQIATLAVSLALLLPQLASASDGVVEINHDTIMAAGGYPYVIQAAGSYMLTGILTPPDIDTDAIQISATDVTIDLRGFGIQFPGSGCNGLSCPQGTGRGVARISGQRATVRNGFVSGAGNDCIQLSAWSLVESVKVSGCGQDGFSLSKWGILRTSQAADCGQDGANLGGGVPVTDSVFSGNNRLSSTGLDRSGGISAGGNFCGDSSCGPAPPRRRFYLTQTAHDGSEALTACSTSFHMASMWEINDPGRLRYDTGLGRVEADSGFGPPVSNQGWIRTGVGSSGSTIAPPGQTNCFAWTSNGSVNGTLAGLTPNWSDPALVSSPWRSFSIGCFSGAPVWCVED